jgi:hypothetical protein
MDLSNTKYSDMEWIHPAWIGDFCCNSDESLGSVMQKWDDWVVLHAFIMLF